MGNRRPILILALIGLIASLVLLNYPWSFNQTRRWRPVPCKILSSEILVENSQSQLAVKYSYDYEGKSYLSRNLSQKPPREAVFFIYQMSLGDYAVLWELKDRFYPGAKTICYVNPADPAKAVLIHAHNMPIYWGVLGLWVALGVVWLEYIKPRLDPRPDITDEKSLLEFQRFHHLKRRRTAFAIVFSAGLLLFYILHPFFSRLLLAATWSNTPCQMIISQVVNTGPDAQLLAVFEYIYDGKVYRSDNLALIKGPILDEQQAHAWTKSNPKSAKRTCWVNPFNPRESILTRNLNSSILILCIPLALMIAGALGFVLTRRKIRRFLNSTAS